MKSLLKSVAIAGSCFLLGALAPAFDNWFRVKVESKDGHRATKFVGNIESVRLSKRLSDRPCRQGRSWGYDRDRIWVDDGCRAEFEVTRRGGGGGGGGRLERATVTIESNDNKRRSRVIRYEGTVTLRRRLSSKPCIQGVSWGYGNGIIWVDRGCRAEFQYFKRR